MNQEDALNHLIGIAKRSPEITQCGSLSKLKTLQQAIRVCEKLAENRAAKRSWRESCNHPSNGRPANIVLLNPTPNIP